ncbi:hypothetical protein ACFXA3_07225 [Streptomyces sp. NPDC059456]|uniref:hypothetical protein n=1 Tax=Streptomyces sp. NPDC059456 TaxID=3346838 RepID=UPI0036988EF9
MSHEPTAAIESETLATSLRAYLASAGFAFAGLTAADATAVITQAVADWAKASGWRVQREASMRYIDLPRMQGMGCRTVWHPPRSAYLDLRLLREAGPSIAVEIDREDFGSAVDRLRDEALRGRPALWIRWHGALRAELPDGVARLHLPSRTTRTPIRYSMAPVTDSAAITCGNPVSPEAHEDACTRDDQRVAEEKRRDALPQPTIIRCR